MLDILSRIADQFDQSASTADMEKHAAFLEARQAGLSSAPFEDFALVLYDGRSYARKFPVQTADDVRMSKEALDRSAAHIPEEAIKVARHHIELAGRAVLGESLYGQDVVGPGVPLTNVLYAGHISRAAYEQQMAKTASAVPVDVLLPGHTLHEIPVPHEASVLQAERSLSKRAFRLTDAEQTAACRALVKRASALGVPLTSTDVTRYDRDALPAGFAGAVRARRELSSEKLAGYFDRLAAEANDMGAEKAAECLRKLDVLSGLTSSPGRPMSKVGHLVPAVDDVVFPVEERVAPEEDLSKIASLFGADFAASYRTDPSAASASLTPEERSLLAGS